MRARLCRGAAVLGLVGGMALALPGEAWAGDPALAQELFDQGQKLMKEGKHEEACAKFEGSNEAEPSVGALLNLARCHQLVGRTASAWAEYSAAAAMARRLGQGERAEGAENLAAELEPGLSRLTIRAPDAPEGLVVTRGGEPVPESAWDVAVAVDPGDHWVEANAPGKLPYKEKVTVKGDAAKAELVIPALEDAPTPKPPPGQDGLGTMEVAAIAAGSVGLACIAVGSALGAVALSQRSDLSERCGDDDICDRPIDVASETGSIESLGHGSTAMFVVGGVGIGAAVTLWLIATLGDDDASEPAVSAGFDRSGGYVSWRMRF